MLFQRLHVASSLEVAEIEPVGDFVHFNILITSFSIFHKARICSWMIFSFAKSMLPSNPFTALVCVTGWVNPLVIAKGLEPVYAEP